MIRNLLKATGALAVVLALFAAGAWIAFVPSAREAGYELVAAWGSEGAGLGEFNDPTGIAIAGNEVFVADARNGRIQVFSLDGDFLRAFGRPGDGKGELGRPMNLSSRDGELYVPEYFNDRIQVFGLDGTPRRLIGSQGAGPGEFSAPGGVAVGSAGELYVADFYNQRVQHLAADGSFIRQWGKTGKTGLGAGEFNYPTDVALDDEGRLYVADGYGDRVQVITPDGAVSHTWGGPFAMNIPGPFNGWFAVATSISVGPEGNIFVADFYNHRVQKFTPAGAFLTSFGAKGGDREGLRYPIAVAAAADGNVFVVDFGHSRITKWWQSAERIR